MALIKGGTSGASLEVGATSKGSYAELIDSTGKLQGAAKTVFTLRSINFTAATSEGMVTLTPSRNGVDGATGTTFTVTSGKRLVILGLSVVTKNAGAAVQGVIVRLRWNPGGAAIVSSPILLVAGAGTMVATANVVAMGDVRGSAGPPALLEIDSAGQIGISQIGTATAGNDVILWGYEY